MKQLLIIFLFFSSLQLNAQSFAPTIDTTNNEIAKRVQFIRNYFKTSTMEDAKKHWHPKLKNTVFYNYGTGIEAISRNNVPSQIIGGMDLKVLELEIMNDSISYAKIDLIYPNEGSIATYKYYIVKHEGNLYFDNAIEYEKQKFNHFSTKNIDYYISPFSTYSKKELKKGSDAVNTLRRQLRTRKSKQKIKAFVCSSIEEINIIANLTKYYGRQGGFANTEANFAAYLHEGPVHLHEYVHVILGGTKQNNSILEEGIATYFGGLNPSEPYSYGRLLLKDYNEKNPGQIEEVILGKKDPILNYSMWATICEYIIEKLGKDKLFDMYYDEKVNNDNIILEISKSLQISKEDVSKDLTALVKNYK